MPVIRPGAEENWITTSSSGDRTPGTGRISSEFASENTAVVAPMPIASVPIATTEKPGSRRSPRNAKRRSRQTFSRATNPFASRYSSAIRS
jgi:hypothetical protein